MHGFVSKNIDSTSEQIDQISLFDRFVNYMYKKESELRIAENTVVMDENKSSNETSQIRPFQRLSARQKKPNIQSGSQSDEDDREKEISRRIMRVM